jgi:hypothetical protein
MPVVFLVMLVLVVVGLIALGSVFERRRRSKWEAVASRNGFQFLPSGPPPPYPFHLLSKGYARKNRNIMSWDGGGYRITLSDYSYTISTGRSSTTYRQTICLLEDPKVIIPPFSLRREHGILDKIGSSLGMQDIDFPEDETFSKSFVLKGNETGVRECFGADLRVFLVGAKGMFSTLEGRENAVLVNFGRRIDPEKYGEYAGLGMELFARFRAACASSWNVPFGGR